MMRSSDFVTAAGMRATCVVLLGAAVLAGCATPPRSSSRPETVRPTAQHARATDRQANSEKAAPLPARAAAPASRIAPGNSVTLLVHGQPDMSATMEVAQDGSIIVAFVGPVKIAGLTAGEASERVAQALRDGQYLLEPRVVLTLTQQFYILGEVQQPNMYRLEPGMTVDQAIARSGGVTPRGTDRRVEITRRTPGGKPKTFKADLSDRVVASDVIRVKERIF